MSRRHEITLTQLRYFATAAERRSMTEAARELFVAQSAVSAAVGQLEQQVGTRASSRWRRSSCPRSCRGPGRPTPTWTSR
jgi:DNA-binding transcriptional LysR family regulator